MRLSISNTSESEIDLGISILGKLLKKHLSTFSSAYLRANLRETLR